MTQVGQTGHFLGKWGKRKRCRTPATVWGEDQQSHDDIQLLTHLLMSLPVNYSLQMVSRTYALLAFWSLMLFLRWRAEAVHAWQLMLCGPAARDTLPSLGDSKTSPTEGCWRPTRCWHLLKKSISAQEASQRQQATLLTLPCLIYCFEEGSVNAFWKSCS